MNAEAHDVPRLSSNHPLFLSIRNKKGAEGALFHLTISPYAATAAADLCNDRALFRRRRVGRIAGVGLGATMLGVLPEIVDRTS